MGLNKAEDKFIDINKLQLHYLDWGNTCAQVMLLLHGFMGHAHVWDEIAPEFRGRYHVIALDQRGHGESQWSNEISYSIDDHFSDLSKFVEALGLDSMVIIGHSMGGRNACFFAACVTEKVDRLILIDSRPGNTKESRSALMQMLRIFPLQAHSLTEVVEAIRKLHPYIHASTAHKIAEYGYTRTEEGKFIPKYDMRMVMQSEKAEYSTENLWPFLENISCPALVVRGEESPFLSKEDAKKMCSILPSAMLKEVPHSTHLPALENPDVFIKAVFEFLDLE